MFPAASIPRTRNVCEPTGKPEYVFGELQVAKAAASNEHANVAPASGDENERVASAAVVEAAGPDSIVVSGGVLSTTKSTPADCCVLPAASAATA